MDKGGKKGVSFEKRYLEFVKKFGTEKECQDYIFQWRWPNGFKCPDCGHHEFSPHKSRNLYECKKCKKQTSITAGTFFHKTRTNLRTWFRMIFIVTNKKISTCKLQENLKIESYETALRNRKKIEEILNGIMDHQKLMGLVDLNDILKWKIKKLDAIEKRGKRLGKKELSSRANSLP